MIILILIGNYRYRFVRGLIKVLVLYFEPNPIRIVEPKIDCYSLFYSDFV